MFKTSLAPWRRPVGLLRGERDEEHPMEAFHREVDHLFEDFWREELRGRPLQGLYTLRIWEDGAVKWSNVEDVQLIVDYRYWTRFGN